MCSILVNVKRSLFGGSSYNCRRHEAAWSGSWGLDDGSDDEGDVSSDSDVTVYKYGVWLATRYHIYKYV